VKREVYNMLETYEMCKAKLWIFLNAKTFYGINLMCANICVLKLAKLDVNFFMIGDGHPSKVNPKTDIQ
jgi:hypothetical protein